MAENADETLKPSTSEQAAISAPQPKKRKEYQRLEPTSPDQLAQEDLMNNCAVKTVISGIMGAGLGLVFGVFMGAMDSAVRPPVRHTFWAIADTLPTLLCCVAANVIFASCAYASQGPGLDGGAAGAEKQTTRQVLKQMVKTTGQRSM